MLLDRLDGRLARALIVTALGAALLFGGSGCPSTSALLIPRDGGSSSGDVDTGAAASDDAGSAACNGANLAIDPANCGRCGHGCLGGACEKSICQPTRVVSANTGQPLQHDAGFLYWIEGGQKIVRCSVNGCDERPTVVASPTKAGGPAFKSFAITDLAIYSLELGDEIWRTVKVDLKHTQINLGAPIKGGDAIAATPSKIVWAEMNSDSGSFAVHVKTCATYDDPCTGVEVGVGSPNAGFGALVANASGAMWSIDQQVYAWSFTSISKNISPQGNGTLAQPLALDGSRAAWIEQDYNGATPVHPLKTGTFPEVVPTTLLADGGDPEGITLDADGVYFTNSNGTVQRVATGSTTASIIAESQAGPSFIVTDATAVYWYNEAARVIMKVAK